MTERLTYTAPEVARLMGVSRGVVYTAIKTGQLDSIRLGRRVLVSRHTLEQLLGTDDLPASNGAKGGEQIEEANGPGVSPSASVRGDLTAALEP